MRRRRSALRRGIWGLVIMAWSGVATASEESLSLSAPVKDSFQAADTLWVMISAALVLMMTAPGLALFYCGLNRR